MTVFAHCDSAGNIHAFISVNAPAGVTGGIVPKPGETVVEVDGVTLRAQPDERRAGAHDRREPAHCHHRVGAFGVIKKS